LGSYSAPPDCVAVIRGRGGREAEERVGNRDGGRGKGGHEGGWMDGKGKGRMGRRGRVRGKGSGRGDRLGKGKGGLDLDICPVAPPLLVTPLFVVRLIPRHIAERSRNAAIGISLAFPERM